MIKNKAYFDWFHFVETLWNATIRIIRQVQGSESIIDNVSDYLIKVNNKKTPASFWKMYYATQAMKNSFQEINVKFCVSWKIVAHKCMHYL